MSVIQKGIYKMRFWSRFILVFTVAVLAIACGAPKQPASPKETFKTYVLALKKKDYTTVKMLLSSATMKMHEKEAKAMGSTVDDIVKRQSLFSDTQTNIDFRNEKVDGERATIEVKNQANRWESVPFVFEDNQWKIDTAGAADKMNNDIEDEQKRIFDELRNNSTDVGVPTPSPEG
ncbi:MAG TPA: DUF4878 domain-containing protein [Pyrinomonadaceae bacterium]|nr:DUF4878 domain-containing protein [Pyrinomonadaceae bacterium]